MATEKNATLRIYKNGSKIGEQVVALERDRPEVNITPKDAWEGTRVLAGDVRNMTIWKRVLPPIAIRQLWEQSETPQTIFSCFATCQQTQIPL